jgi:O-antigen/teichoic acid export membrane protein
MLIFLGSTMIIARLLTPEQLGIYAIVAGISSLLAAFKNFGTSNYLVQTNELSKKSVGAALTVSAVISSIVGLMLFAGADPIADFFGQPEMELVAKILAINFLFSPVLGIGTAILVRLQRFRELIAIEIGAGAIGAITSILLVLAGFGPVALAYGTVAHSLSGFGFMVLLRLPAFTLRPRLSGLHSVLNFGAWSSGVAMLNQVAARGNEIIIGKQLGVEATAVFDKGLALPRLVAEQILIEILRVLLPVFAEKRRAGVGNKATYLKYLGILASILGPAYAFLAVYAGPLVDILFGDQWAAAVPIATLAAIELMIATPFLLGEKVMIAEGRVRRLFMIKVKEVLVRAVVIVLLIQFGLIAVSAGFIVSAVAYAYMIHLELSRTMGISGRELANTLLGPALAAVLTASLCVSSRMLWEFSGPMAPVQGLFLGGVVSLVAWMAMAASFNWPVFQLVRQRFVDMLSAPR